MTTPEHNKRVSIARRMADKRKRDAARAALADIGPDYLAKLRHECLKAATRPIPAPIQASSSKKRSAIFAPVSHS